MRNQRLHSFRSVKSESRAFDTFQDNFLVKPNDSPSPTTFNVSSRDNCHEMKKQSLQNGDLFSKCLSEKEVQKQAQMIPNFEKSGEFPSLIGNLISVSPEGQEIGTESLSQSLNKNRRTRKNKEDANSLGDFSAVLQLRESEMKKSNDKLLEMHIHKDGGKVIPFVKRFFHKLKNSTSLRDVTNLKSWHFKFLADAAYFFEEIEQKFEISRLKGVEKYLMNFKNIIDVRINSMKRNILFKRMELFIKGHQMVIHPYHHFKIMWDMIHLLLILIWLFYVPLTIAFEETHYMDHFLSLYSMIFLIFDIFLKFNTAFFKNGVVERRRKRIFSNYYGKKLFFDIFTTIPMIIDYSLNESPFEFIKIVILLKVSTIWEISHRISEIFLKRKVSKYNCPP